VVAPEHDRSGAGQSISMHLPLRVYAQDDSERRFALSGTPADCVLFALAQWFGETPPDLVLSGVNCGANVSDSVQYSGTVGAVLSAEHMGIPAMALSQAFLDPEGVDWSPVTELGEGVIRALWDPGQSRFPVGTSTSPLAWRRRSASFARRTSPAVPSSGPGCSPVGMAVACRTGGSVLSAAPVTSPNWVWTSRCCGNQSIAATPLRRAAGFLQRHRRPPDRGTLTPSMIRHWAGKE